MAVSECNAVISLKEEENGRVLLPCLETVEVDDESWPHILPHITIIKPGTKE